MSLECSECERDLRGGHADDCSRIAKAMKAFDEFFRDTDDGEWEDLTPKDAFLAGYQAGHAAGKKKPARRVRQQRRVSG